MREIKVDFSKFLLPSPKVQQPKSQVRMETVCGDGEDEDGDDDDDDPALPKVKDEDKDPAAQLVKKSCSPDLSPILDSSPPFVPLDCPASTSLIGHHQTMVADILPEQNTWKRVQNMEKRQRQSALSSGWGSQLPDPVHHQEVPSHDPLWWRPWETVGMLPNTRLEEKQLEERTGAGTDLITNSSECPLLPATEPLPPPIIPPSKAAFSPFYPSPPRGRLLRRARKKRSIGDLMRRRQRLIEYQLNHTPPVTPSKPEPDQSSLESGSLGLHSGSWSWDSPQGPSTFLSPPWSLQHWWPTPGWATTPLPCPSPPPTWTAPPPSSSPAFCDGCQRWGNLLSVTVSQTRAH